VSNFSKSKLNVAAGLLAGADVRAASIVLLTTLPASAQNLDKFESFNTIACNLEAIVKALPSTILFAALFLLGAVPASAVENKWDAVQWAGTQRDCSTSSMNVRWRVTETDKRIILQNDIKSSGRGWRLNASQLNPDGSGRVVITYHHGTPARFNFAAGHGPRMVYFSLGYHACVWELHPA